MLRCSSPRRVAARRGAIEALAEIGRLLGIAIGSLANIFDPDVVDRRRRLRCRCRRPRARACATRGARARRSSPPTSTLRIVEAAARRRGRADRRRARRVRGSRRSPVAPCRSPSARRRSATSPTSRCGCSRSSRPPTSSCARTRDTPECCSSVTAIERDPRLLPPAQRGVPRDRAHAAARCRRADGARLGRRPAGGERSRRAARSLRRSPQVSPVTVLPGPSAVETALVASGLAAEQYRFVGYLPRGEGERAALWRELAAWPYPTVAFESPKRLPADAREPRRCRAGPARRRLPRADEGLRGGRLRNGCCPGRAVSRSRRRER